MDNSTQAAARLKAWIMDGGRKSRWVATQLGVSEVTLSKWLTSRIIPGILFRVRIEYLTDGAIKEGDWE